MNWLLIAVAVVLLAGVLLGIKKGLITMAFSMLSLVISLTLTAVFAPVALNWVEENTAWETDLGESLKEKMVPNLEKTFRTAFAKVLGDQQEEQDTAGQETLDPAPLSEDSLKTAVEQLMSGKGENLIVSGILRFMFSSAEEAAQALAKDFAGTLAARCAHMLMRAGIYLLLLLLFLILTFIAKHLLNLVAKLPGLRAMNRILGALMGFLEGLIAVDILLLLISFLSFTETGNNLMQMVQESTFLTQLNHYNVFLLILGA